MLPMPPLAAAYFNPPPGSAVSEVLRAVRELPAASCGEVTRYHLFEALRESSRGRFPDPAPPSEELWRGRFRLFRGGPLCEALFGPLGSQERKHRIGHLRSTQGLLHPVLAPAIGERLGLSEQQVLAVACYRAIVDPQGAFHLVEEREWEGRLPLSGPGRLEALLKTAPASAGGSPDGLILHLVPVVPPALIPLELEDGDAVPGPIHVLYARLLRHIHILELLTSSEPEPWQHYLIRVETRRLQEMFGRLCRALSGQPFAGTWDEPGDPEDAALAPERVSSLGPPQSMVELLNEYPEPTRISHAAIAGPDSLLLAFPYALLHLRRADGALLGIHPAPHSSIAWVDGRGQRAVLDGDSFFPIDLEHHRWDRTLPDELVCTRFVEIQEQSWLRAERTGRMIQLLDPGDYPDLHVYTPDHRYVWAEDKEGNGGIYHLESARPHAMPFLRDRVGEPLPLLSPSGERSGPESYDADEWFSEAYDRYPAENPPAALVRTASGTFRFYYGFVLVGDNGPLLRIAQYPLAAAFSRTGDELLLVDEEQAVLYAVGEDAESTRVLARYPLSGLGALLSLEGLRDSVPELEEEEVRARVLAAVGSVAGLASGSSAQLPPPLDAELGERLIAAARKCSWPDRLPPA